MLRGVTDYLAYTYCARKTEITTKRGTVTASFTGVGTAGWAPPISNPIFEAIKTRKIDWLKRAPSVRELDSHKWEIITEWWGIEYEEGVTAGRSGWSSTLYSGGHAVP
jgi:hypothetical protein